MSGVGLLVKTFTPRRRRRRGGGGDKRGRLELDQPPPDLVAGCEAPPITPPPAFLPPGFSRALGKNTQHTPVLCCFVASTRSRHLVRLPIVLTLVEPTNPGDEVKKEKGDSGVNSEGSSANGGCGGGGDQQQHQHQQQQLQHQQGPHHLQHQQGPHHLQHEPPTSKPERPSSLGPAKLTRRILCYHNDLYNTSPNPTIPHSGCDGGSPRVGTPPPGDSPLILSELPEPPIPLSEIGPIPPPPMFSSQPSSMHNATPIDLSDYNFEDCGDGDEYSDGEGSDCDDTSVRLSQPDPSIDTTRVEEIPAKEPKFHAVPLKSALKKPPTPTQESPQPQYNTRPVRFGLSLACTLENKENTRPPDDNENSDSSGDGPILYRDDDHENSAYKK
ncbi:hypothetical protein AAG570_000626 [Ranatra chinensis]|uniref:Uncharacterized protein n=1 Tax=Ranatra chinensis TaxID=642074 RepID=A0ABD0YXK8_9HEMI